jgi:DNA-directed RNA polymerase specialized sigma24 family protein
VYNHAFRLTGAWSATKEVMSMTFLEAWRCRDSIAVDGGSLRPWLLGIATNLVRGSRADNRGAARVRLPHDDLVERRPGVGGPPAAESAAYRALATLPGITVQPGIKDTADGQAIGISDDGG